MLPVAPYAAMRVLAILPPHEDFAQECLRQALALSGDSKDGLLLRGRLDALRANKQLPLWSSRQAVHLLHAGSPGVAGTQTSHRIRQPSLLPYFSAPAGAGRKEVRQRLPRT